MAYHDDLRHARNQAPGTPLGYDTRPPGGGTLGGLVLAAVVLAILIALFAFAGGGDRSEPGSRPVVPAESVEAPAVGDAAPAPVVPTE